MWVGVHRKEERGIVWRVRARNVGEERRSVNRGEKGKGRR